MGNWFKRAETYLEMELMDFLARTKDTAASWAVIGAKAEYSLFWLLVRWEFLCYSLLYESCPVIKAKVSWAISLSPIHQKISFSSVTQQVNFQVNTCLLRLLENCPPTFNWTQSTQKLTWYWQRGVQGAFVGRSPAFLWPPRRGIVGSVRVAGRRR